MRSFSRFDRQRDGVPRTDRRRCTGRSSGTGREIIGSAFNDDIRGNINNNVIEGGAGADTILGNANDLAIQNGDIDTVSYASSSAAVRVALSTSITAGGATQQSATFNGVANGDAAGDIISNTIENVTGSAFSDLLIGNQFANRLEGGAGNDTLQGNDGDDTLIGGAGNDLMDGGNGNDTMVGGDGVDTVDYSTAAAGVTIASATVNGAPGLVQLGAGNVILDVLSEVETVLGTSFADSMTGNALDNRFDGGAGADTLNGGAGNDTLNGGADNDTLNGGDGDDLLVGGASNDTIEGGAGTDTVNYSASGAAVQISLTDSATAFRAQTGGDAQGDLLGRVENIVGSAFNDDLRGNNVANVIEGGAGADIILGNAKRSAINNGDIDTASYANSSAAVGVALSTSTAAGGATQQAALFNGVANGDAAGDIIGNTIENLIGSSFGDLLIGNQFANRLDGGAGNDTLQGNDGDDTLVGGLGDDTMQGGNGNDTVDYSGATAAGALRAGLGLASRAGASASTGPWSGRRSRC